MPKMINDYIEKYSKPIDNDSIVFIFETGIAYGISRDKLLQDLPAQFVSRGNFNYFYDYYKFYIGSKQIRNVLYKNKKGEWIKIFALINEYPNLANIYEFCNSETDLRYTKYLISNEYVPEVYYTDKDNNLFKINERDNSKNYITKVPKYIDELNPDIVELSQFSIENPTYSFNYRHLMYDLRIKIKDESIGTDNLLINLNGIFVEPVYLTAFPDSVFIKNARWLYKTIEEKLKPDAEPISSSPQSISPTANVEFGENAYYKNYSIRLRLFKWNEVNISNWISINFMNYYTEVLEYKNVRIPKTLSFQEELNPDNTIILCNGMVMKPSEYVIRGNEVDLRFIKDEFYRLYGEFKEKNMPNALNLASEFINDRRYYAIKFTDTESSKTVKLRRTSPMEISFLSKDDVLFDEVSSDDFILVDGIFLPYTIKNNGLVEFPKLKDSNLYYSNEVLPFRDRAIEKIEVVNYYHPIDFYQPRFYNGKVAKD